jgi:hypothetical protein
VGEQAALRQPGAGGQRPDGQASEPDVVGDLDTVVEDRLTGQRSLAHVGENSTIVRFVKTCVSTA